MMLDLNFEVAPFGFFNLPARQKSRIFWRWPWLSRRPTSEETLFSLRWFPSCIHIDLGASEVALFEIVSFFSFPFGHSLAPRELARR